MSIQSATICLGFSTKWELRIGWSWPFTPSIEETAIISRIHWLPWMGHLQVRISICPQGWPDRYVLLVEFYSSVTLPPPILNAFTGSVFTGISPHCDKNPARPTLQLVDHRS
jgi:hypothetical protein